MSILDKLSGTGCESHLTALITKWQKGFRNHPFRQLVLIKSIGLKTKIVWMNRMMLSVNLNISDLSMS